ncbi:MAG: hypothetical protein EBU90_27210 [Proteobacteria bacterium]|nr:hypothetical protein [Pseudomonadota bacterium]NBP14344.1 hypothetical protein [bacterium]
MNKKITTAMLLVLIQSSIYSALPEEDSDWMQVKHGAGGQLEVTEVRAQQPTHDQATSTVSDQVKGPEDFQLGCCAAVADLLKKGLKFLEKQAYGELPFAPDEKTDAKNK